MFTSLLRSWELEIRNTTAEDSISIKSINNIELCDWENHATKQTT